MYTKWLRSFHAVACAGGFTAASRKIGIGQPTITAQVKALESRFNVELFYRRGRRVELSAAGRSLLEITRGVFGHEEEAIRFLSATRDVRSGQLNIGAVTPFIAVELLDRFHRKFPELQIRLDLGHTEDVLRSLRDFDTDVALLSHLESDRRLVNHPYRKYRIVAMVQSNHPWASRPHVSIRDLSQQRMIIREPGSRTRRLVESEAEKLGVTLTSLIEINSREGVCQAVARGLGVGVISQVEFIPLPTLCTVPISGKGMFTQFYVTALARRHRRPLIDAFFQVASEMSSR